MTKSVGYLRQESHDVMSRLTETSLDRGKEETVDPVMTPGSMLILRTYMLDFGLNICCLKYRYVLRMAHNEVAHSNSMTNKLDESCLGYPRNVQTNTISYSL